MADGEVSLLLTGLRGLGLNEAVGLAQMVVVQFVGEGLVGGFGEHRLFLEDGHDTHGLFHQLDASLEIHTEIHEDPIDTFLLVLFLFKNEHVMVEKLLQFLIGEVDAKLLKSVEVEDFKSSNIQDTDELDTFLTGLQSLVDTLDQPLEETIEDGLSHGTDRVRDLVDVTTLGDELVTDLDPGLHEVGVHELVFNSQQLGDAFTFLFPCRR